ncbi:MAG: hypothetical protein U9O94_11505 [Nanoarchaeota archaeon]|nr:hypothetical protein [Nanoarchaeota archaeon]
MLTEKSFLIISLCIIILLAGCSQNNIQNIPSNTNKVTQTKSISTEDTYNSCSQEDFSKGDAFYFPIFSKDNSPTYCRPNQERSCYSDMCYTKYLRYAGWKKDVALCEKLDSSVEDSWKDKCIYEVSFFVFDRSVCNKITNEQLKLACLMSKEGTDGTNNLDRALYYAKTWFERCSRDPTLEYEHSLDKGALPTQKQKVECQIKILDYLKKNYEKECSDKFCDYFNSFNPQDISSCEIVPEYTDECVITLIYGGTITSNDCNKLSDKDYCLNEIAVKNEDIDLCLSLEYADCLKEIAVNQQNVEVCFKDDDSFSQEMCVEHYATELGNFEVCSDERYLGDTNFCEDLAYDALSSKKKDVEYCYKIHDQEDADWCVAMYAGDFKDSSVCNDPRFKGDKSHCLSQAR